MYMYVANAVRAGCTNGDLRLKGGAGSHEGRVEICVDETWGSVCSSTWSSVEASVACRSLGFLPFGWFIIVADDSR